MAPKEAKATKDAVAAGKPAAGSGAIDKEKQKQQKKLQQQVQKLEQQIESAEQMKATLQKQLEDPALWNDGDRADEVQKDFATVGAVLTQLTSQWEQAAAQLEALERG